MKKLLLVMLIFGSFQLSAQDSHLPVNIGYYAPYGISPGLKLGTALEWKSWKNDTKNQQQTLAISPQIAYWNYTAYGNTVHNTWNIEIHLDYKKYFTSRFYGLASAGLSYQIESERESLSVDLGTGQVTPTTERTSYIVPMLHLGVGRDGNRVGYYFKTFLGQRLTTADSDNMLVGAELGLTFYLKKK